jgi:hypothetical protein
MQLAILPFFGEHYVVSPGRVSARKNIFNYTRGRSLFNSFQLFNYAAYKHLVRLRAKLYLLAGPPSRLVRSAAEGEGEG